MKRFYLIALCLAAALSLAAQQVYSVVTCPAQNTATAMQVSWGADSALASTWVEYTLATDASWARAKRVAPQQHQWCTTYDGIYSAQPGQKEMWEHHRFWKNGARLTGLKRDTPYKYRIVAHDGTPMSQVHHFKTSGARHWSACVISDFHTWTPLPGRLAAAMAMVDTVRAVDPSVDWVLSLGDVVAWGASYSYWQRMYAEPNFARYMWAGLEGNHDHMSRRGQGVAGAGGLSDAYFRDAHYLPPNGYAGQEGVCYYFHYGDALFVMLNNEAMHDEAGREQAKAWLKRVAKSEKHKYLVVCMHYEWFDGPTGKPFMYDWFHDTFDACGVDLALAGNSHIYNRSHAIYQGRVTDGTRRGTVYIQSTSSDNGRGRDAGTLTHSLDFIARHWSEGTHTVSAMLLDVDPRRMTVTLYDRTGRLIDQATIPAKRK